ncbi:MAG: M14 family zinc carboxypeptidase, partial [Thermoanaerobaculia bacterium]
LEKYRTDLARLADPRGLSESEKTRLIHEAKPIYWLSGSIHSPETGSPEMLMELAYRLVVDESENSRAIRNNEITIITPVSEVDGRDRMVDADREARALKLGAGGVPLIYWGKYTAHDNNRDGIVLSQKLTQNIMAAFLQWKPVVVHDLHESVPFLYTSTGTGPYNDEYDPIVIDEWHTLAYQEITELTRRGLPGVWTHGFYDGWAPNYTLLSVANLHNSIGRFYETYTSHGADCGIVKLRPADTERRWDRPNPPVNGVKWCIRSNINYQESGVLIALRYVADHKETFLTNYEAKAERMIERGRTTAPYAFVIPKGQRHAAEAADLVNLFRAQGSEINVATQDFTLAGSPTPPHAKDSVHVSTPATIHTGDWIVRLDQPYSASVRTLLAIQKFKADDPPPYDDTGWTLDVLRHVETIKVTDSAIFTKPMQLMTGPASVRGNVATAGTLLVKHLGDWRSAALPWKVGGAKVDVADAAFTDAGVTYPAGTYIVEGASNNARDAIAALGLNAVSAGSPVTVAKHAIAVPHIALMHTWLETQNEGWVRFALEQMGVPYTYIADQSIKKPGFLDKFDVVIYPHVSGSSTTMI